MPRKSTYARTPRWTAIREVGHCYMMADAWPGRAEAQIILTDNKAGWLADYDMPEHEARGFCGQLLLMPDDRFVERVEAMVAADGRPIGKHAA